MVRHDICGAQVAVLYLANAASSYGGLLLFDWLLQTGFLKVRKKYFSSAMKKA